jgi:long-chain fatty acid transport protein
MAEFAWTREARLKQLRIDFKSTTADSITAEHWKDSTKVARRAMEGDRPPAAAHRRQQGPLARALGHAQPRPARLPPHLVRAGRQLGLQRPASMDFSFGHVKLKDAAMNATDDGDGETPCNCAFATARGNYTTKATIFGVQFNHKF